MYIVAFIIVLLLAIFIVAVSRKTTVENPGTLGFNGGNAYKNRRENPPAPRNPYRATSIVSDEGACEAVMAIGNKRFLDTERNIPKLPLPGCDVARCNCKYLHHEDRRASQEDRRIPNALQAQLYDRTGQVNRRARKRGRRKTDWA